MRQAELAKVWGVDPSYVSRLVKKGCPMDSLNAANEWRRFHTDAGTRSPNKPSITSQRISVGDLLLVKTRALFSTALELDGDNPALAQRDVEHLAHWYCNEDVQDTTVAAVVGLIEQATEAIRDALVAPKAA